MVENIEGDLVFSFLDNGGRVGWLVFFPKEFRSLAFYGCTKDRRILSWAF